MKVEKQTIEHNKKRIEELNRSQKNYIRAREKELEQVKKFHDNKVVKAKMANELDLVDLRSVNKQKFVEENENHLTQLSQLKENQDQLKSVLQKERNQLETNQQDTLKNIQTRYQEKIIDTHDRGKDQELEINDRVNETIKDFEAERNTNLVKLKNRNLHVLTMAEADQKEKVNEVQNALDRELLNKKMEFTQSLIEQKSVHNKKVDQITNQNTHEVQEREQAHQYNLKDQQSRHVEHLKADKEAFKEKFEQLVKNQQMAIKNLEDMAKEQSEKIKDSHSKEMKLNQSILNDPFYQITKLTPQVEEKLDSYVISIETPEHEKDKFTISANKRKIRFNLARRFEDRVSNNEGENKSTYTGHRTESYTKEFFVDKLLEPSGVTHKWENGRLYFKIKKA